MSIERRPKWKSLTFYWCENNEKDFRGEPKRAREEKNKKNSVKIKKTEAKFFDLWNIFFARHTRGKFQTHKEIVLIIGEAHKISILPLSTHIFVSSRHSHHHFQPQHQKYWREKFIIYSLCFHRCFFLLALCVFVWIRMKLVGSHLTASGTWLKWCRRTEE